MIKYEAIKEANDNIRLTDIKGKGYAEVNQRIKAFRMVYPNGTITTDIVKCENGIVLMKAQAVNEEGVVIGTGYAYEKENSTFINKTSYIENCETSAVGRALGMCGFGIDTSVASAEEVQNEINNQGEPQQANNARKPVNATANQIKIILNLYNKEEIKAMLNRLNAPSLENITVEQASTMIKARKENQNEQSN